MFYIPERYKKYLEIKISDFIPKDLKPNDKKRIREVTRSVRMTYQIAGEEIPSLIDEEHRCQVIQYYEIEIKNIKDANYMASLYQSLIKPLCFMRFYDSKEEVFSFADKRLSQTEEDKIVVEDMYISQRYSHGLPGEGMQQYANYLSFESIKNKEDKLAFYRECMYKIYILEHMKAYPDAESIVQGNFWYSTLKSQSIYHKYIELVKIKEQASKTNITTEKIKVNKEIRLAKDALEQEL